MLPRPARTRRRTGRKSLGALTAGLAALTLVLTLVLAACGDDGSFDYDYTIGDDTTTIEFEPLTTVAVGEQQVDILVARKDQSPDHLSATSYQARFKTLDVSNPAVDSGYRPMTSVISISFDPDDEQTPLTDDEAAQIIASLQMPDCSVAGAVAAQEASHQVDLNEDGHVSTMQDLRKIMMGGR